MENSQEIVVTPWVSHEEWNAVAKCILIGTDPKLFQKYFEGETDKLSTTNPVEAFQQAIEEINIWKARTHRLAAGIETTLCLLEGAIMYANSNLKLNPHSNTSVCLCLATSINRFLNLICHTGFNLFGLTKYFDVADRFSIPDWIVEVRHETAHGHMPSKELLLDALAFSLKWITLNYWVPELQNTIDRNRESNAMVDQQSYMKNTPIYEKLHKLFYCYRYLKLYNIWGGVVKISDLSDQIELYNHIVNYIEELLYMKKTCHQDTQENQSNVEGFSVNNRNLARSYKRRKRPINNGASYNETITEINELKIANAMNLIRDKIHSFICSLNNGQVLSTCSTVDCEKALVINLLQEEFLLPSREFFDSLVDPYTDENTSVSSNLWAPEHLLENYSQIANNSQSKPMKLPKHLVQLWSDVLQMIATDGPEGLLSDLLYMLHEVSGGLHIYASGDECLLKRCLATAWIIEICDSLSNNILGYRNVAKENKHKKNTKMLQKGKIKEIQFPSNILRLSSDNVSCEVFQDSFCRRIIMNPLTELTLSHLPSVLSLVHIRNSKITSSSEFKLYIPIDEKQKMKILQLAYALFGMNQNPSKSKMVLKLPEDKSTKTVHSISDYISKNSEVIEKISSHDTDLDIQFQDKALEQQNLFTNSKVYSI